MSFVDSLKKGLFGSEDDYDDQMKKIFTDIRYLKEKKISAERMKN